MVINKGTISNFDVLTDKPNFMQNIYLSQTFFTKITKNSNNINTNRYAELESYAMEPHSL
jgi:hypothetical protein